MSIRRSVREACATVAWRFASDPGSAACLAGRFAEPPRHNDPRDQYDREKVAAQFGEEAAKAWEAGQKARRDFFAAALADDAA